MCTVTLSQSVCRGHGSPSGIACPPAERWHQVRALGAHPDPRPRIPHANQSWSHVRLSSLPPGIQFSNPTPLLPTGSVQTMGCARLPPLSSPGECGFSESSEQQGTLTRHMPWEGKQAGTQITKEPYDILTCSARW